MATSTKKMVSACHCIVLLFLLVAAGLSDAADVYNILDLDMEIRHEQWKAEYGRVYKDEAEKARRFEIFKKNVRYIEDFNNAGEYNYTLGVNEFADLTTEEFMSTHTGAADAGLPEEFELPESFELETADLRLVPSSFDWRDEGAVTEVKNQGFCASCWAFATVATVESLTKIKKGVLYSLSEQQVMDCERMNRGCKPGYSDDAYQYMTKGITTEANYPYKGVRNKCDLNKAKNTVTNITGFILVRPYDSESALKAAVARQPVTVVLQIAVNWQFFRSGLYSGPCGSGKMFGHAVAAVGYGETGTDKYWILKNSWGNGWSENGYIKLKRDVGIKGGLCGVATYASYPYML